MVLVLEFRTSYNFSHQTLLIYDVGSTKIQTTVVQYRLSNESKENGPTAVPRMEVIGVGFNPELGGHHLTLKLRELLIDAFRKQHPRTDGDITSSPQAMAKLLREADRVKQVTQIDLFFDKICERILRH
jgi:hypoxia up-regulated 1